MRGILPSMPLGAVKRLGRFAVERARAYGKIVQIAWGCARALASLSFANRAVFPVILRQFYFTAVQALPLVLFSALVVGSISVHYILQILTDLVGAYELVGTLLIHAVLHEIAPILCTMILLVRSGTAVISEVSLMKINRELDTLEHLGIDLDHYVHFPRVAAFILAGPSLTLIFSVVSLVGSFLIFGFRYNITFGLYLDELYAALTLKSLLIVVAKPVLMSAVMILTALQKAMDVEAAFTEVPVRLIQGLIRALGIIIVVELFFALL
ncbi:MAG: ABC transporter permease [Deltaproteobacteria bacterium]|nr:ABC transporter permease [Deltaproteobacteria bacterium]RLB32308.1 MAG: hypothetical protein DRH20_14990 [Deltaproteobacteria bacterium]